MRVATQRGTPTLYTATRRWRAAVVVAALTIIVTSSPAPGVLAAEPTLARRTPAGPVSELPTALPPTSQPAASPPGMALDATSVVPIDVPPIVTQAPGLTIPLATGPATSPPARASPVGARVRPGVRPVVVRRSPVRANARPFAMWAQLRRGLTITGAASWYPGSLGYAGIAHVAMPGARYLGRGQAAPRARVCVNGRCLVVPVVDACGCSVGSRRARVADLSVGALRRLGLDPARGVYRISVTLVSF
jgi:hypothetical protein